MRTPRRATVLIADDHRIVMEGLVSLLKEDFDVVGAVGDGPSLLESARILRPEVVVTDISMPGLSGLDVLSRIREDHPTCKIIVLTMHDDAEMAARARGSRYARGRRQYAQRKPSVQSCGIGTAWTVTGPSTSASWEMEGRMMRSMATISGK